MDDKNILKSQIIDILIKKNNLEEKIILAKTQMLIALGLDVNTKHKGKSLLIYAKENNLIEVSKYLIKNGGVEETIPPKEQQKLTNKLVSLINSKSPNLEDIREVINEGANLNIKGKYTDRYKYSYEELPLFLAIEKGHKDIVELLLSEGADVNIKGGHFQWSALHQACYWGQKELVELFIEKKLNINEEDNAGQTPIILACRVNNIPIVKTLIKNCANITKRTSKGHSLLEEICENRAPNITIASFVIDSGFDINIPTSTKNTTFLMHAINNKHTELAKLLIERGANVNAEDDDGNTALIFATNKGYEDIVDILLQNNANPLIKNKSGLTAIDIAEEKLHFIIKYKILDAIKEKKEKISIFSRIKQGIFFDK